MIVLPAAHGFLGGIPPPPHVASMIGGARMAVRTTQFLMVRLALSGSGGLTSYAAQVPKGMLSAKAAMAAVAAMRLLARSPMAGAGGLRVEARRVLSAGAAFAGKGHPAGG